MSKITLQPVTNLQTSSAVTTINNNSNIVQTAMDNTLSRDGTSPNQMNSTLDMNSNRIINLPVAASLTEPVRLQEFNQAIFGTGTPGQSANVLTGVSTHSIPIAEGSSPIAGITLTSGQIIVGQTGLDPAARTLARDAVLDAAGNITVTKTNNVPFVASATTDTTNAVNISSGLLPTARLPALTGDVTSVATTPNTTVSKILGNTVAGTTGAGNVVFSTAPTLANPVLGTAQATTLNKVTITQPATGSTMTVADGKVLTVGNSLTLLAGADGTVQTFPSVSGNVFNDATKVPNSGLANMAANTLKGNPTNGSTGPTDFTVDSLTLKNTPSGGDEIMIWDVSSNGMKKATVATVGASAGVASVGGSTGAIGVTNGLDMTGSSIELTAARRTLPTRTTLTSGSGTYTTPANCLWLEVTIAGGGGGGCGGGIGAGATGGGTGGTTTFGTALLSASGGSGGTTAATTGLGGGASGGDINLVGGAGGGCTPSITGFAGCPGGKGGDGFFGGSGAGVYNSAGTSGAVNTGGGGGGGGGSAGATVVSGAGGGSGGYCTKIINTPNPTYAYSVGVAGGAGAAGTNGFNGGNGGSGIIIVVEHYGT